MSLEDPARSPNFSNSESPVKEFFNFLFYKRIARALSWVLAKIDEYLSEEDYVSESRTSSRVNSLDKANTFSLTSLAAWVGAFFAGVKILLLPIRKLYQYAKWRKDPEHNKKPVFTLNDFFYLCIDITVFVLAVVAAAFVTKFLAFIISLAAAAVTVVAGIVQFVQAWKNNKNNSNSAIKQSLFLKIARPLLTVTVPSMCLVAAGFVLLGAMLGPVGVPFMMVGAGIGAGATLLALATVLGSKIHDYVINKSRRREFDEDLMRPRGSEQINTLTLREKITRMSEIKSFLKENKDYNSEQYQAFFKSQALVNYLQNTNTRSQFKTSLKGKLAQASHEFLKTHPLSEKKEIPLKVIVEHVIQNPRYAKTFLSKRYGTVFFGRRNFRKELSARKDLVLKLKLAAANNVELAKAIKESKLENSRHFKKRDVSLDAVRSCAPRLGLR